MNRPLLPTTARHDQWLEEFGEVELIGGWAEVALGGEVAALVGAAGQPAYQVFVTAYDPVLMFVQNRSERSFEIHATPLLRGHRPPAPRCAYCVIARRVVV